jgi:hypothetical protein
MNQRAVPNLLYFATALCFALYLLARLLSH